MKERIVECENELCTECFTLNETIIDSSNYLFCPWCGKRYKYNPDNDSISLAPIPTTFTYCRKCGTSILKVHRWQDAVCDDDRCIKESELEIKNLDRDKQ